MEPRKTKFKLKSGYTVENDGHTASRISQPYGGALSESFVVTPSDMDATGNEAQAANPEVTVYAVQLHL